MRNIVVWGLSLLAAHLGLAAVAQAQAEPKPVLALIEYGSWSGMGYPWPVGLQFVAYDNGLIIKQAETGTDRYGNVRFISLQKEPAETAALAARVKAELQGARPEQDTRGLPTDQGWTIIQYWDAENSTPVDVAMYGMPCVGSTSQTQNPVLAQFRAIADQRFLALCDELLRLDLPNAADWFPESILVTLQAEDARPELQRAWPADWPRRWKEMADQKIRAICVPLTNQASDLTVQLLSGRIGRSVSVEETVLAWWIVKGGDISMPGAIHLANHPERALLEGPCARAAFP